MQGVFGVLFALLGLVVTTAVTGRSPSTAGEFAAYAIPGGILGYLFGPALAFGLKKLFGGPTSQGGPPSSHSGQDR